MVLKNFVSQSARLASRPRVLTTTFMCALSATIRLASTADEGAKRLPQPIHAHTLMVSLVTGDDVPIFCRNWKPKVARPIVFRMPRGCCAWPL
jgi:hypothetical protein